MCDARDQTQGLPHAKHRLYHGATYMPSPIKQVCTSMFMAALFSITNIMMKKEIRKMWYVHTMEYHSALKRA
jgi:hypothetical protein